MAIATAQRARAGLLAAGFFAAAYSVSSLALDAKSPAYRLYGKTVDVEELAKQNRDKFFELEKEKFQLIDSMAKQAYLEAYWTRKGKESGVSSSQAQEQYMQKHIKTSDAEFKETFEKYKNHEQLKALPKEEQEKQIRNFLRMQAEGNITQEILSAGIAAKELVVVYPQPVEPNFSKDIVINAKDHTRFGPSPTDTAPMKGGCTGDNCPITVLEYVEYQCGYCARALPTTVKILDTYKGKIRWVMRHFPLNFHPRARPAAIASECAAQQGQYWQMYTKLFENQQALEDKDFKDHAAKLKLDETKFAQCLASPPAEINNLIDAHLRSAQPLGVSGTPAFFINGRRFAGAMPPEEFQRVIDEELKKKPS